MMKRRLAHAATFAVVAIALALMPAVAMGGTGPSNNPTKTPTGFLPQPRPLPPPYFYSAVDTLGTARYSRVYGGFALSSSGRTIIYVVPFADRDFLVAVRALASRYKVAHYTILPVSHTWNQLNALTMRINSHYKTLRSKGLDLARWGPDAGSNRVIIQLRHVTNTAISMLIKIYGSRWIIVDTQPFTKTFILRDRLGDTSPWYGGDGIWRVPLVTQTECTTGFAVVDTSANYLTTTAGHCWDKATWETNILSPRTLGSTFHNFGPLSLGGFDFQTIKPAAGSSLRGIVWGNGTTTYNVKGILNPAKGALITFDGAYTGEVHDVPVYRTGPFCESFGNIQYCSLGEAISTGPEICLSGDSGGPVFLRGTYPNIDAIGTITASDSTGTDCVYTRIQEIQRSASATILIGP